MGAGKSKKRLPGAEYRALWRMLGGPKYAEEGTSFGVVCMFCGRKKDAIWVRENEKGSIECYCRACKTNKEQIYKKIGFDGRKYEIEAVAERELEKAMPAMDMIGANRCTACEHYVCESVGHKKMYGCKIRNLYRIDELWADDASSGPCQMFQTNRNELLKGLNGLDTSIEAYEKVVVELRKRRALLAELLDEK